MRIASWVLLTLVGGLNLLASLGSSWVAYQTGQDQIGPVSLSELAGGRPEVATAIRARRGTAAAWAAGFATLFLFIVLGPYRRGDVWAWWAVLAGALVVALLLLARIPFLGTRGGGAGAGAVLISAVVVALLLDVRRLLKSGP
jgi:hypothetical protein